MLAVLFAWLLKTIFFNHLLEPLLTFDSVSVIFDKTDSYNYLTTATRLSTASLPLLPADVFTSPSATHVQPPISAALFTPPPRTAPGAERSMAPYLFSPKSGGVRVSCIQSTSTLLYVKYSFGGQ
ncbi:hypothetical protein L596_017642 [Steinernema carpocapsae]|uniref:Uncharacterized protein n=1 Tax=Steinernema carpocapsae TaxID=34508 RepID=A0A4U5N2L2_STECR|nr:hypothetical protein L596_017642 [Steinernema carpocapsae]